MCTELRRDGRQVDGCGGVRSQSARIAKRVTFTAALRIKYCRCAPTIFLTEFDTTRAKASAPVHGSQANHHYARGGKSMMSNTPETPTYRSGQKTVAPAKTAAPQLARAAALQFLGGLAAELSSGTVDLPCFPNVVIQIRNALEDPKTTIERAVTIVGAEPRLTARLLQTANSAAFNQSGKLITDLKTAITRLGQQLVQSAAMAFAVQQMKNEESLRSIAPQLSELWRDSIAVASICQVVARRTKVGPDEAFLTGLLHGIGRLYIIVRAVSEADSLGADDSLLDLISGWHASIGKAVLENWGFSGDLAEAIGEQCEVDRERRRGQEADLLDVLIAGIHLAGYLKLAAPRKIDVRGMPALAAIGLSDQGCSEILLHAEYQLGALQDSLGC
jgi:HD-like signal output (HDOD) protein